MECLLSPATKSAKGNKEGISKLLPKETLVLWLALIENFTDSRGDFIDSFTRTRKTLAVRLPQRVCSTFSLISKKLLRLKCMENCGVQRFTFSPFVMSYCETLKPILSYMKCGAQWGSFPLALTKATTIKMNPTPSAHNNNFQIRSSSFCLWIFNTSWIVMPLFSHPALIVASPTAIATGISLVIALVCHPIQTARRCETL